MISISNEEDSGLSFGPDLTPLLDVVFIVMVFLLFTANVQTLSIPVNLPQASQQEASVSQEPKNLTVSILNEDQSWAIGEDRYENWDIFTNTLLAQVASEPDTAVLIAGDQDAPLGDLVKLMMFLSHNNIEAAQILMDET